MSPQLSAFDHNDAADAVFDSTGIAARAKRAGDLAPDITLPDGAGRPVRLSDVWRKGPLVLVFFRGGWCGYCNLQLRAWQQQAGELARLGATSWQSHRRRLTIQCVRPRTTNSCSPCSAIPTSKPPMASNWPSRFRPNS